MSIWSWLWPFGRKTPDVEPAPVYVAPILTMHRTKPLPPSINGNDAMFIRPARNPLPQSRTVPPYRHGRGRVVVDLSEVADDIAAAVTVIAASSSPANAYRPDPAPVVPFHHNVDTQVHHTPVQHAPVQHAPVHHSHSTSSHSTSHHHHTHDSSHHHDSGSSHSDGGGSSGGDGGGGSSC